MRDAIGSNDDRLARRRARRWRRRAALFAPFFAVPGMLVVLMLSVNLIEHRPDASERTRATGHATRPAGAAAPVRMPDELALAGTGPAGAGLAAGALSQAHSLSQASVIANAVGAEMPLPTGHLTTAAETTLFDAPAATTSVDDAR